MTPASATSTSLPRKASPASTMRLWANKHTSTKQAPSRIATCGDKVRLSSTWLRHPQADTCHLQKISSACSCLTTTTPPPTTTTTPTTTLTTSTSTTSTCARSSASACPTSATKCCAYLCAEAQVPFDLCSETDTSGQFQKCSKCPVS